MSSKFIQEDVSSKFIFLLYDYAQLTTCHDYVALFCQDLQTTTATTTTTTTATTATTATTTITTTVTYTTHNNNPQQQQDGLQPLLPPYGMVVVKERCGTMCMAASTTTIISSAQQ